MYLRFNFLIIFCLFTGSISAEELPKEEVKKTELKEECVETKHTIKLQGREIEYKAEAGTILLKDEKNQNKASLFYVAYTKEPEQHEKNRPITYCFNGGPGSSSVWLHLGVLGPKRVALDENGCAVPPYEVLDNEHSLLDFTDLVFIDPVSTGFSRAAPGEDPKQFHGVDEDIQWVGEFIRIYTTRHNRWASPKFLAGESYGTTRAAGLVSHLHDELHMHFNGVILISTVLNFQTLPRMASLGNDLPYILALPSYAAAAWYHEKLPEDLLRMSLEQVIAQARKFAEGDYTLALMKGDQLNGKERDAVIYALARYTGLTPQFLQLSNMRVGEGKFTKELLRDQQRTIGRFDCRIKGIDQDACGSCTEYDPSSHAIVGGFSSALQAYLHSDLKCMKEEEYRIIANVRPWNYGEKGQNQYLNVADNLADVMSKNPYLRIFVASGYYDLATPFSATDYTFNHLGIDPSLRKNITKGYYEGGHMMYTLSSNLQKLNQDLGKFIQTSCQKPIP